MRELRRFVIGFRTGVQRFGEGITNIVNSILLTIVYFIGVGITSLIARAVGKKFFDTETSDEKTYWSDLNLKKRKMKEYYRQF